MHTSCYFKVLSNCPLWSPTIQFADNGASAFNYKASLSSWQSCQKSLYMYIKTLQQHQESLTRFMTLPAISFF